MPMVWSFDSLRHLTVTVLKTERHKTQILQNFRHVFDKSRYGKFMREYRFTAPARACVYAYTVQNSSTLLNKRIIEVCVLSETETWECCIYGSY